jgi:hypothetical protein
MMQVVGHVVKMHELNVEDRDERKNEGLYAENLMNNNFNFNKELNVKCSPDN